MLHLGPNCSAMPKYRRSDALSISPTLQWAFVPTAGAFSHGSQSVIRQVANKAHPTEGPSVLGTQQKTVTLACKKLRSRSRPMQGTTSHGSMPKCTRKIETDRDPTRYGGCAEVFDHSAAAASSGSGSTVMRWGFTARGLHTVVVREPRFHSTQQRIPRLFLA